MHSSRMRTVRFSGGLGVGVCRRGCTPRLWTEFLTHACENITFPQVRLRTVINTLLFSFRKKAKSLSVHVLLPTF